MNALTSFSGGVNVYRHRGGKGFFADADRPRGADAGDATAGSVAAETSDPARYGAGAGGEAAKHCGT